jgi:F-box-like
MVARQFQPIDDCCDVTDDRFKMRYTWESTRFKCETTVDVVAIPMASFMLNCISCFTNIEPQLIQPIIVHLNWVCSTKQMIKEKFQNEFVVRISNALSLGISELPNEMKLTIARYMSMRDLVKMSQMNRDWHFIAQEETLWERMFKKEFSASLYVTVRKEKTDKNLDWKELFKREYLTLQRRHALHSSIRNMPPFPGHLMPIMPHDHDDNTGGIGELRRNRLLRFRRHSI